MATPGAQLPKRPILNFAPDLDSVTPGVVLDGHDFYPVRKGMRTLPSQVQQTDPLPDECRGAASLVFTDQFGVIVAGTLETLCFTLPDSILPPVAEWVVQNIGPSPFPLRVRWRFAIYKDMIFAVDGTRKPFVATRAGINNATNLNPTAWAPLTIDPPLASIVATSDFSLFLVGANSATWYSTVNPTIWVQDVAQLSVSDTINQTSGPITAAAAQRSNMVLYKEFALYVGTLSAAALGPAGVPVIWQFTEVSRQVGTVSQETLAVFRDIHYFLGPDDFYSFDGFSLNPLPNDLKEWFFQRIDEFGIQNVRTRVDTIRSCIFWHFRPVIEGLPTDWICYNVREQRWSKGLANIDCAVDGPITVGSQLTRKVTSGTIHADDHALYVVGAESRKTGDTASVTTGDIGDRHFMYQLTRVRPFYQKLTGLPTCTPLNLYTPGGTWDVTTGKFVDAVYVAQATVPLSADGWFNLNNTARLQRLRIDHDDDAELIGLEIDGHAVGEV